LTNTSKKINATRELAGVPGLTELQVRDELYSDFLGDQFSNPEFWHKLNSQSESLTKRLLTAIKRILQSYPNTSMVTSGLPTRAETGEAPRAGAEQYSAANANIPTYTISEKGVLTKTSKKAYIDVNQRSLFDEGIPDSGRRTDNAPTADETAQARRMADVRGRVVSGYRPESGTLPKISSKPIGTWRSSRSAITTSEDAAVIARDNIGSDAQEVLVSIATDESGKILATNRHSVGGPSSLTAVQAA